MDHHNQDSPLSSIEVTIFKIMLKSILKREKIANEILEFYWKQGKEHFSV